MKSKIVFISRHYRVKIAHNHGNSFSQSGYSKYFRRLTAKQKGKLRGHVYGLAQAIDHVTELRRHVYEGKKIYADTTFIITREDTIERNLKTLKPLPARVKPFPARKS